MNIHTRAHNRDNAHVQRPLGHLRTRTYMRVNTRAHVYAYLTQSAGDSNSRCQRAIHTCTYTHVSRRTLYIRLHANTRMRLDIRTHICTHKRIANPEFRRYLQHLSASCSHMNIRIRAHNRDCTHVQRPLGHLRKRTYMRVSTRAHAYA